MQCWIFLTRALSKSHSREQDKEHGLVEIQDSKSGMFCMYLSHKMFQVIVRINKMFTNCVLLQKYLLKTMTIKRSLSSLLLGLKRPLFPYGRAVLGPRTRSRHLMYTPRSETSTVQDTNRLIFT